MSTSYRIILLQQWKQERLWHSGCVKNAFQNWIILFFWVVILRTILYIDTRIVFINHCFDLVSSLLKRFHLPLLHLLRMASSRIFNHAFVVRKKKLNIHPYIYLFPNYTPVVARCVHHTASLVYHIIFMFGKIDLKKKTCSYICFFTGSSFANGTYLIF